jgi:4-amino-4-deoxy-L-arabinose transferase-like glycosyltransferase
MSWLLSEREFQPDKRSGMFRVSQIGAIFAIWLAFLLRVWGLDFGLPYEFHPDEHQYVNTALSWHTTGDLTLTFINPPLFTYVLSIAYWPWFVLSPFTPFAEWITTAYVYARLWSVAFGVLTVALAYALGTRIYNRQAGLLSMILLAGLFLPARESHFAVNDTAVTFFVLLAIYFSVILLQRGRLSVYLGTGVAIGLATAAKLTGGVVVIAFLLAHISVVANRPEAFPKKLFKGPQFGWLVAGLAVALATFLFLSSHVLWDLPRFVEAVTRHLQFGSEGYKGLQMSPSAGWVYYIFVLGWGMGWLMIVATVISVGLVFYRRHFQGMVVAIFPVTLFVYMGAQNIVFARFILPAIPPLVVLVAVGLVWSVGRRPAFQQYQPVLWPLIIMLLLAQPLANLVWFDHLLTLPDTREIATEWFSSEFPEDTVVTKESYSILSSTFFVTKRWPYKVLHLDERGANRNDVDYYLSHKTEIIALSNFTFERVRSNPLEEAARLEQLANLEKKATLIKTFSPYRQPDYRDWFYLDQLYGPASETLQRVRPGPLLKLYRLDYDHQPYSTSVPDVIVPVRANFDDKLMLLGYDLPARRSVQGEAIPLTLYWQALNRMHETYVIFNHVLDDQQVNWGGYDRWPQETANTILWTPGEVVVDTFNVPVAPDAPDGIYTIDVGLYDQADPQASPLPILQGDTSLDQNSVRIGPVKIGGPPPDLPGLTQRAEPNHPLSVQLGQPPVILLEGYDLIEHEDELTLTLYWESLDQTTVDWSIFVHLRNEADETVAQMDGPAGGSLTNYPASLWDPQENITDEVVIPLPPDLPAETYTLVTGLYDLTNGMRLAVPGTAENEIILSTWERSSP